MSKILSIRLFSFNSRIVRGKLERAKRSNRMAFILIMADCTSEMRMTEKSNLYHVNIVII